MHWNPINDSSRSYRKAHFADISRLGETLRHMERILRRNLLLVVVFLIVGDTSGRFHFVARIFVLIDIVFVLFVVLKQYLFGRLQRVRSDKGVVVVVPTHIGRESEQLLHHLGGQSVEVSVRHVPEIAQEEQRRSGQEVLQGRSSGVVLSPGKQPTTAASPEKRRWQGTGDLRGSARSRV